LPYSTQLRAKVMIPKDVVKQRKEFVRLNWLNRIPFTLDWSIHLITLESKESQAHLSHQQCVQCYWKETMMVNRSNAILFLILYSSPFWCFYWRFLLVSPIDVCLNIQEIPFPEQDDPPGTNSGLLPWT